MKRYQRMISFIFPLLLLAGCLEFLQPGPPATPLTKVYELKQEYNSALKVIISARQLGKINDADYHAIMLDCDKMDELLKTLDAAARSGQPLSPTMLNQAQLVLDSVIASKSKIK